MERACIFSRHILDRHRLPLMIVFASLVSWAMIAGAAEQAKPPAAHDAANCELILEGAPIELLVLRNERGESKSFRKPGNRVMLPPGQYTVEELVLQGGYSAMPTMAWQLVLAPDKPCRPSFGATPTPIVTAKRAGRLLTLSCELRGAAGWRYRPENSENPPQFAIYQGDALVGSGTFEYG